MKRAIPCENGFTIMQMVITIAIIAVVTGFGVLGITTARAEFRLQNSARLFASYVEKARADSIRRHVASGTESSVETFGPGKNTYAVTMDFGSGVETRSFSLESGLSFNTAAKKLTFDWRGRISSAWVFQVFSQSLDKSLPVDVSGSGDITVGEQHFPDQLIPPVVISAVTGDTITDPAPTPTATPTPADPNATPTPTPTPYPTPTPTPTNNGNGGDNGNGGSGQGNGNGNPTPTPTPIPTPTPTPNPSPSPSPIIPECVVTISPDTVYLSQSDESLKTGHATFTLSGATGTRVFTLAQEGNGNSLVLALSLSRMDGNGTSTISVTSKNGAGNRGVFVVDVIATPACGTTQKLNVSVSN